MLIIRSFICLSLFSFSFCFGQTEKRIKQAAVPKKIIEYVETKFPESRKTKYYKSEDGDSLLYVVSIVDKDRNKFNLEFYRSGQFYEMEKEVEMKDLPPGSQQNIINYLQTSFRKFKILKIEFVNPDLKTEYELLVKGKKTKEAEYFEIYFDDKGLNFKTIEIEVEPISTLF